VLRVWNLQSKNNFKVDFSSAAIFYWPFSSVIDRNRNRSFNLIQNKVGYCSCFAMGVKLGTIFMKQFWRCLILDRKKTAKFWRWPAELIVHLVWRVFFLTLSGISCVTILKYTLILSAQFTKSTENKTSNPKIKSYYLRN
jgi:hypothetical protein